MIELGRDKKLSGSGVPFPAIVGQEDLKEALLVVGANQELDGLLIRGEKGTAKSTAARAFAGLLPPLRAVADCPFGCPPDDPEAQCARCRDRSDPPVETRPVPFVPLPLGASRERVVGSLSVADALDGSAEFNPGLLARANRGVLYVDEVNLLDDHLVDVLLSAAASGVNRVERDGVSATHPAAFTLVGTMNPEEGDLRPQFRDRFALQVEVEGASDPDDRVAVVERALAGFDGDYGDETAAVRERLAGARARLPDVSLPDSLSRDLVELCRDAGVDGHRADVATARAARTLAALDSRERVVETDVRRAAALALPHRLKARPFEDAPDTGDLLEERFGDESDPETGSDGPGDESGDAGDADGDPSDRTEAGQRPESAADDPRAGGGNDEGDGAGDAGAETADAAGQGGDDRPADPAGSDDAPRAREPAASGGRGDDPTGAGGAEAGEAADGDDGPEAAGGTPVVPGAARADPSPAGSGTAPELEAPKSTGRPEAGRARADPDARGRGGRVRTEPAEAGDAVDAAASVRAAATRGADRVETQDLRRSVRTGCGSTLVVFALDASASMRGPMRAAKGVALDLLRDAYEARDEVALVTFAGDDADVVLPPTDSVDLAARHLKSLPTGDRTPLPAGLAAADDVLARADPDSAVVVVVTDGRANAGADSPTAATRAAAASLGDRSARVVVVDAGADDTRGLVSDVVEAADARRIPLSALSAAFVDRVAGD